MEEAPSPPLRPQRKQEGPAATTNVPSRSLCHTVQQGERVLAVGVGVGVAEAGAVGVTVAVAVAVAGAAPVQPSLW